MYMHIYIRSSNCLICKLSLTVFVTTHLLLGVCSSEKKFSSFPRFF